MAVKRVSLWRGLIFIILIIAGFFFLLKSCLSQFDERFAMPPILYFEKDGKAVVLALIQFQDVSNYSSKNGVTRKSIDAEYFLQSNDAITGTKIMDKYICNHAEINAYPVEIIGAADNKAWVFIGELMAFDPFTLEKVADTRSLEEKNPALKDKFPKERTYYVFDAQRQCIFITAKDGSKWKLDLNTLTAAEAPAMDKSAEGAELAELNRIEEKSRLRFDSINASVTSLFKEGRINRTEYGNMLKNVQAERDVHYKLRDSLSSIKDALRNKQRTAEEKKRKLGHINRTISTYQFMRSNQDTLRGRWTGLYSAKEMAGLSDRFSDQGANDETERRQLYMSNYDIRNGELTFVKQSARVISDEAFLHGGFLLDKKNAEPIRFRDAYLILHKDQVGQEGKIIVSRLDYDGKLMWSFNSGLKEWNDWILAGTRLIVLGSAHEELSSGECNVLWCIDLETGKAVMYDYFKDK